MVSSSVFSGYAPRRCRGDYLRRAVRVGLAGQGGRSRWCEHLGWPQSVLKEDHHGRNPPRRDTHCPPQEKSRCLSWSALVANYSTAGVWGNIATVALAHPNCRFTRRPPSRCACTPSGLEPEPGERVGALSGPVQQESGQRTSQRAVATQGNQRAACGASLFTATVSQRDVEPAGVSSTRPVVVSGRSVFI
jgi:hypothetical protein